MWELIRANKRNSIILMIMMAAVLLSLGAVIGGAAAGRDGISYGIAIAAAVWFIQTAISFSRGDQILLTASGAKAVTHDVHPQLFNVVEEMKIAAGLPAMPKVYIINDPAPNAFATGRSPQSASVAVTAGLLGRLNRDELQGVIAHEISHITHRDILFVTMAGIMLGSIVLMSDLFLRGMFRGSMMSSRRRYSSGGKGGGQAQAIMLIIALLVAILAPIMAYLLYFALSRRREYLADAGAARLTRYPEGLASALEKIAGDRSPQLASVNKVTAPMYIVNPFKKAGQMKLSDLTNTHPPISERIRILRNMGGGASFADYAKAYSDTTHRKSIVPPSAVRSKEEISVRQPFAGQEKTTQTGPGEQMHQIGDIMRRVNQFTFLACPCGLQFKIPPDYKSNKFNCPRCHREHTITEKSSNARQ